MKVILIKEIKGVGKAGETKEVAEGHARNFLLPNKLAIIASEGALKEIEKRKQEKTNKAEKEKKLASDLANKLRGLKIEIRAKSDDKGTLFAGIGEKQIAEELNKKGYQFEAKQIKIKEHFKKMGDYEATLETGFGFETKINIKIVGVASK